MPTITIPDKQLAPFYQQNPGFDILGTDLNNQAQTAHLNWTKLDQPTIVNQLQQYQRLLRLNPDPAVAQALLGTSKDQKKSTNQPPALHSAFSIATLPKAQFIQQYASLVGGETAADQMHARASTVMAQVMQLWATTHNQVASPYTQSMTVNNVSAGLAELADLPGYQDLFGSLNYCECDECASIFGPAAYFVDLLRVIEQYVSVPTETDLQLSSRRPDLSTIQLTCANTNNLVPYLDIITNILVQKAANILQVDSTTDDPTYEVLAVQTYPFNLPFNLLLEQVRRYLGQLNTDLATIYSTFNVDEGNIARETVGLSQEELTLITTAHLNDALASIYGLSSASDLQMLNTTETFLKQTELSWQTLQDLFTQNLSPIELHTSSPSLPHSLFINWLENSDPLYLQLSSDGTTIVTDSAKLTAPIPETLDRLNRFIRLSSKLHWSFSDLNWAISSLHAPDINAATIPSLAQIKQLQNRLKLPIDVLCSLWHDIKTVGVGTGERSQALFDILFNAPGQVPPQVPPYHPIYAGVNPLYTDPPLQTPAANTRIAAGLRRNLTEVNMLIATLWPDTQTTGLKVDLTVQNLSLLYRHSLCATILQQPLDAYFLLLKLTQKSGQMTFSPADVLALLDCADWLKTSSFTTYELAYILQGTQSKAVVARYQDADIEPFLLSLDAISPQDGVPSVTAPELDEQQEQLLQYLATFMQSNTALVGALMPWISAGMTLPTGMQNYTQTFLSQEQDSRQVVYWPFATDSGSAFYDQDGKQNGTIIAPQDSTFNNWPVVSDFPGSLSRTVLQFSPTGNYATLPATSIPTGNEMTVSFWTRCMPPTSTSILLANSDNAYSSRIFNIHLPWNDGYIYFDCGTDSQSQYSNDRLVLKIGPTQWQQEYQDKWVHWTFTKNASTGQMKIYANGQCLLSEGGHTKPLPAATHVYLGIDGDTLNGPTYSGEIAEFRIWHAELSSDEVLANYYGQSTSVNMSYIRQTLASLSQLLGLADKLALSATEIASVSTLPGCFGFPTYVQNINLDNVRTLSTFQQLTQAFQDTQDQFITYFAQTTSTPTPIDALEGLVAITGWQTSDVQEIMLHLGLTTAQLPSVSTIAQLKTVFDLNAQLGANVAFHDLLLPLATTAVPGNWNTYTTAAKATLNLVRSRYSDDDWVQINENLTGMLNEQKRDVLTGFVLWKLNLPDLRRLSEYLLIDVEMSGCASISVIKQAILSVQMYLQRCRMNLEPGADITAIPAVWWEWLMNYRIWQANRKVFMYPENYLDPALRKNQTELFQAFAEELSQTAITDTTVENAYRHYLDGFAQLAQLQIIESYRCNLPQADGSTVDTLFLFGRTASSPATFYYRTCVNPTLAQPAWTPWVKIDLSIRANDFAPVFAFNKLFLFWTELSTTTSTTTTTGTKTSVTKATIRYTYQTFSGTWSEPQTLLADQPIDYEPATYKPQGIDMVENDLLWQKPYALALPGDANTPDRILVFAGQIVPKPTSTPPVPTVTTGQDAALTQFNQQVYQSLLQGYASASTTTSENMALFPAITLSSDLLTTSQLLLLPTDKIAIGSQNVPSAIGYLDASTFKRQTVVSAVSANYLGDFDNTEPADGLIGYWPMDETSGTIIHDRVGGHDGTIVNPLPTQTYWSVVTNFPGIGQRSVLQFGTSGRYATLPPESLPTGNEITVSFWTYGMSASETSILSASYNIYRMLSLSLCWGASNPQIYYDCGLANGKYDRLQKATPSDYQNNWRHWAFTKNVTSGAMKIYYQGELLAQSSDAQNAQLPLATQVFLGKTNDTNFTATYAGKIAELRIWKRELSAAEISLLQLVPDSPLLEHVVGQNNAVQTVKNQPDWSTLASGGEAFLMLPQTDPFQLISENITVQGGDSKPLTIAFTDPQGLAPTQFLFTRLTTSTIHDLSQKILTGGIDQLLTLASQLTPEPDFARFQPTSAVIPPAQSTLDFHGPYGSYFQEIFFYMPFLIADMLNANQRFAESQQWYNYIFNPTQPFTPTRNDKLVSYWPLDGGPVPHDTIGNQNATVTGTASWPVVNSFPGSPSRTILQFATQGSYANLPPASIPTGNEITVSFWTCWTSLQQTSPLFAMNLNSGSGRTLVIHVPFVPTTGSINAYNVIFDVGNGKDQFDDLMWNMGQDEWTNNYQGKWVQWTFTKNARTGWMKIYVNGQLKCSAGGKTIPLGQSQTVYLAYDPIGNTYDGELAELRIWNIELSATEVLTNYYDQPLDNYWGYLPFRGNTLETLTAILQNQNAIKAYNDDPFDPDAIAQLRVGAYQKAIVMKYIDNLLDWGDALFTQDTWESITQATLLYFLASDLLGPAPEDMGSMAPPEPETFADIQKQYGNNIPQFLLQLETLVGSNGNVPMASPPFNDIPNAYFCVSENDQFISYWGRVEDRLYKIRHSQNISGATRQLALFEPPIDPAVLVRAVAAGVLPLNAIAGLNTMVPAYRFETILERAKSMTGILMQLGGTLLTTLEKRDAEQFSRLKASQETLLLRLMKTTKQQQIDEANASLDTLNKSLAAAQHRNDYYQQLITGGWSVAENVNMGLMSTALGPMGGALALNAMAAIDFLFPTIFGLADGGMSPGMSFSSIAAISDGAAAMLNQSAALSALVAQYERRDQDWHLQLQMVQDDITVITQQIAASQLMVAIATSELVTHQKSIEQASQIEDFLQRKFTNQELYQWMVNRLSITYFQTFKLVLDLALSAQKAYQYELNQNDSYIDFSYWDDLKQGLLAGEGLMLGLTQLEKAYLDRNVRRLEIEKTISLLQLDPLALLSLKATGQCSFSLTEELFDQDFPGHYCRQIKSLALSIPAIVGPYQNINATLTQNTDRLLLQADPNGVDYLLGVNQTTLSPDTTIVRSNWRGQQKIALSRGVNDSGVFELNFRDERYLPFEGTGAVSDWTLLLPQATNRFNLATLSDVIIHLSYTALDGGSTKMGGNANMTFADHVKELVSTVQGAYYLNFNQSFAAAWYTFLTTHPDPQTQQLTFTIPVEAVPAYLTNVHLTTIYVKLDVPAGIDLTSQNSFLSIQPGQSAPIEVPRNTNPAEITIDTSTLAFASDWVVSVDLNNAPASLLKDGFLDPTILQNIECIFSYKGNIPW